MIVPHNADGVHAPAPDVDLTGPMPATFEISSFSAPATTSTKPTLRTVTLDELVKLLTTHTRRLNKDGQGWSGAKYKTGTTRANANVVEWSVAGADFDHFTFDQYHEMRDHIASRGLAAIFYSTFTSTTDDVRFRVAIPFTRPVPKAQYAGIWHAMNAVLFGGKNDPQTKDPSRMLFTPAHPADQVPWSDYLPGAALDWAKLPPVSISTERATTNGSTSTGQDVGIGRQTMEFLLFGAEAGQQRLAALRATRSLLAAGKTVDETAERVWQGLQASPIGDATKPWTYDDALKMAEDLASKPPPPLEEWPTLNVKNGPTATGDYFPPPGKNGRATVPGDGGGPNDIGDEPPIGRTLTETGNAERLVDQRGRDIHFCHLWNAWLHWDGRRWKRDTTGTVRRWSKDVVRSIYAEAARIENGEIRAATVQHAKTSEKAASRAAMLKNAEVETGIPIEPDEMDRDGFLFNVQNGTVDLRTGKLKPHDRCDTITKLGRVFYDAAATAPTFMAFLERVLPEPDVRAFLQRAVGYCLTASMAAQCLFFLYGGGANGKSTLLTLLGLLLGEYARHAAPELLTHTKNDRHPTELADLFGARLVTSVEVDEGKRLAETLIKQMTGGDPMKGRFMRADFFEWMPTHKLWLAANHRTEIRGTDYAIWRRIHLIPFTVTIPENERDADLPAKLAAELPGILNWAIAGCLEWQRSGLGVPQVVRDATNEYRQEQDVLADFIGERCILDRQAWVPSNALYKTYEAWGEAGGDQPLKTTAFGRRLTERGLKAAKGAKGVRIWQGIRLLSPDEEPPGGRFDDGWRVGRKKPDESSVDPRDGETRKNVPNAPPEPNAPPDDDLTACTDCGLIGVDAPGLACDACMETAR